MVRNRIYEANLRGVSGPLSLPASAQQSRDRADKAGGRLDGRGGSLQRHYRVWTCLVVGDRLKLVSSRKKAAQIRINSGLVCNQLEKLSVDPPWVLAARLVRSKIKA